MSRRGPDIRMKAYAPWTLSRGRWSHMDVVDGDSLEDDGLVEIHVRLSWKAIAAIVAITVHSFWTIATTIYQW